MEGMRVALGPGRKLRKGLRWAKRRAKEVMKDIFRITYSRKG